LDFCSVPQWEGPKPRTLHDRIALLQHGSFLAVFVDERTCGSVLIWFLVLASLVVPYRPRANVIVGLERKHITVFRVMSFLSEIVVIDHEYRECSAESAFNQMGEGRSPRDAIRSQWSTCSRHNEKETGNEKD